MSNYSPVRAAEPPLPSTGAALDEPWAVERRYNRRAGPPLESSPHSEMIEPCSACVAALPHCAPRDRSVRSPHQTR